MTGNRSWWYVLIFWLITSSLWAQIQDVSELDPQANITVGKIYITGNNKTRTEIILRELDFKEGQELKLMDFAQKLVLDQQQLENLINH